MKAFSEKCDMVLSVLKADHEISWARFSALTGYRKDDCLLQFLKNNKGLIDYTDIEIQLTEMGKEFINSTSFVQERNKRDKLRQHPLRS